MSTRNPAAPAAHTRDRLKSVAAITSQIAGFGCLDDLLSAAAETISQHLDSAHVGLMMIEGDRLVLRAASDEDAGRLCGRFSLEIGREGITGWVAASGRPLLVPDVSCEPRYVRLDTDVPVLSALAVPLRIKHKIIGVVDVDSSHAVQLGEDDLAAMEVVADHIALAIENAVLYQRLHEWEGQVRQPPPEHEEATEVLVNMKTTFDNNEHWTFFERRDRSGAEVAAPSFDPLVFAASAGEPIFPEASALTAREVKILELIAQGLPDKAIAQRFVISPHTVNAHLRSIYRKLGTHSRTGAVNLARLKGIID